MSPCAHVGWPTRVASLCSTYSSTAVQWVQQQYSRFAVLVQQYSQYSWTHLCQRLVYCSTAIQQYSSTAAVQQYSRPLRFSPQLTRTVSVRTAKGAMVGREAPYRVPGCGLKVHTEVHGISRRIPLPKACRSVLKVEVTHRAKCGRLLNLPTLSPLKQGLATFNKV